MNAENYKGNPDLLWPIFNQKSLRSVGMVQMRDVQLYLVFKPLYIVLILIIELHFFNIDAGSELSTFIVSSVIFEHLFYYHLHY